MTSPEVPRAPKTPVIRCRYCVEGGDFKVMIGQGGAETWYMCARCGHLAMPTNPLFKCTCAKCVELTEL